MADEEEKERAKIQKELPDGWHLLNASPAHYTAQKRIENGTLMVQFGGTPEELVDATTAYDKEHARAIGATPAVATGTLSTAAADTPKRKGK